jgi:phage repressor protein C with HTH and peptisase S24 domain
MIATTVKRAVAIMEHDYERAAVYLSRMLSEWLQEALKTTGVSQADLGRYLTLKLKRSIDRAAVNKMAKGTRNIAADEMIEIVRFLEVRPPDQGLANSQSKESEVPNAIVRDKLSGDAEYIPLYGHAVGGVDGEFVLNGNILDHILAPPGLSMARGAYAVTCAGESMEPRYFDGETVFVDPVTRVRRGDFVVAQIRNDNEGSAPLAFIKRFVRHNDKELVLEQFNPSKELHFKHDDVVSVHYIVLGGRTNR